MRNRLSVQVEREEMVSRERVNHQEVFLFLVFALAQAQSDNMVHDVLYGTNVLRHNVVQLVLQSRLLVIYSCDKEHVQLLIVATSSEHAVLRNKTQSEHRRVALDAV